MALALVTLRREAQAALDDRAVYVSASGSTTSFTSPQLVNATAGASTTRINAAWAFIATGATAGQQKRVRTNGYTPSTGVVLVYPDWAAPVPGAEIELTRLFPCAVGVDVASPGEDISYRSLINTALRRYPIQDQITLSTVDGQRSYSLSTYAAWLTSKDRVLNVLDPPIVSGYPGRDGSWRVDTLDFDAGVPTLRLKTPYEGNNEVIRIDVIRPANTLISGAESQVGLVAETDTVLSHVRVEDFLVIFKAEAYKALAVRGHDGANWNALAETQEAAAQALIVRLDRRARGLPDEAPVAQGAAA